MPGTWCFSHFSVYSIVLMPRKTRPRMNVSTRQRTSALFLRISAHHTPIAMVKLDVISTAVLAVPQPICNWCDASTNAG